MLVCCTSHSSASATRIAYSTAVWLTTGSVPGMPEQIGHTAVLGAADVLSTTSQAQNIFDLVCSSAWTSRPMTGSYSMRKSRYSRVESREPGRSVQDCTKVSAISHQLSAVS